jgi:hypothetical protein
MAKRKTITHLAPAPLAASRLAAQLLVPMSDFGGRRVRGGGWLQSQVGSPVPSCAARAQGSGLCHVRPCGGATATGKAMNGVAGATLSAAAGAAVLDARRHLKRLHATCLGLSYCILLVARDVHAFDRDPYGQ